MRPSLKNISKRSAERARDAAAGSSVPAGQEQPSPDAPATPTTAERAAMRKRARRLARVREVQLRELGALVVEMRRLGRDNPDLLARKALEALGIDNELRRLRAALGERETVEQVVAAGVAGTCARCGTLLATEDRFCAHCGLAVATRDRVAEPAPPPPDAEPIATQPPPAPPEAAPEATAPPPLPEAAPKAAAPPPPPPPPTPQDHAGDNGAGAEPAPDLARPRDQLTATAPPKP
jgi:hypothetical protein